MYMSHQQAIKQQGIYHQFNGAVFSDVSFGFMPAFKSLKDERVHLSTDSHGKLSVMHLFDGLPDHWVQERDEKGKALCLKSDVIAGFMRDARFYTLSDIMHNIIDS